MRKRGTAAVEESRSSTKREKRVYFSFALALSVWYEHKRERVRFQSVGSSNQQCRISRTSSDSDHVRLPVADTNRANESNRRQIE